MLTAKDEYELDYWRKVDRAEHDRRQRAILRMWRFTGAESVLEIGTGPWGGCLPFVGAQLKVGIDPLYAEYGREIPGAGLCELKDKRGWWQIGGPIEMMSMPDSFDAVLSMNALDHGDSDFRAVDIVARLLKPGGLFYLHVHLRRPDQLNVGHDHCLLDSDLDAAIQRTGLHEVYRCGFDRDPIEGGPYRTVIGAWRKC